MYKRCFFKYFVFLFFFFVFWASQAFALNPSYLFLEKNSVNTASVKMVLLVTPTKSFSSGSELTISFPDNEDEGWCKQNDTEITVSGAVSSLVNTDGWTIDLPLPGILTAKCYQGLGENSYDRIVVSGIDSLSANTSYGLQIHPNANFSTGPNGGTNNIVVELERGLERVATAFAIYLHGPDGLLVTAFIDQDNFSTVQVLDPVVEKGIWSRVRVRILSSQGNPIPGRTVNLRLDLSNTTNWEIEQPSGLTNIDGIVEGRIKGLESRLVDVLALDKSFSQDVFIDDRDTLTVRDVAKITLNQLPMYTTGLSREITWSSIGTNYNYFIECSLDPQFGSILKNSGWITTSKYTFQGLEYGKAYYYRGKARNIGNVESDYSNIVSSIQAERPTGAVEVLDPTVEKGVWSNVRVRVLDSQGQPMSGRTIILNIDRPMANWAIEQPTSVTDNNGYTQGRIRGFEAAITKVTAVDRTIPLNYHLEGFDWLRVTEVPTLALHELPRYSKGLTRLITWNFVQGDDTYQYYIESSTDINFTGLVNNSGWVSLNEYLYQNLVNEQTYFYRGMLRNSANVVSSYSNVVFSSQDNQGPTIDEMDFEVFEEQEAKRAKLSFLIKDFSSVSRVEFECKNPKQNNEYVSCGSLSSSNNFHDVSFTEDGLQDYKVNDTEYYLDYCVNAWDIVGNNGSLCAEKTFKLEIDVVEQETREVEKKLEPKKVVEPEPVQETRVFTPVTEAIGNVFKPILEIITRSIESTVAYIQDMTFDDEAVGTTSVAIVSTVTPITIFTILFNPANFYPVGQIALGLVGLFRRKKKVLPYGFVYNAVTKEPINRAIVRVFKNNKLVSTAVTDAYGVFTANLEAGQYYLKVVINGYTYPTKLIKGETDRPFENIYRGGKFIVEEESQVQYSIPLDPIESSGFKFTKTIILNKLSNFISGFQKILVVVGLLVAFFLYLRTPDVFNLTILLFYIPLLFLNLFLSYDSQKSKFGVVRNKEGQVLKNLELGLREMEFERIVAKRVSNDNGRYKFVVPGGKYRLEVLNPNYEIKNLKGNALVFKSNVKKPLLINKNLVLVKKEKRKS